MQKQNLKNAQSAIYVILCVILAIAASYFGMHKSAENAPAPAFMPWASVGGCGVGGASTGSSAQLQWIGSSNTNSLFSFEALYAKSIRGYAGTDEEPSMTGRIRTRTDNLLLRTCVNLKQVQAGAIVPAMIIRADNATSGILGDIALFGAATLGMNMAITPSLTLSLPTGEYKAYSPGNELLAPEMQPGSGIMSISAGCDISITREWATLTLSAGYTAGLFGEKTTEDNYDTTLSRPVTEQSAFSVVREGWGARNDRGLLIPDNAMLAVQAAAKSNTLIHGLRASCSIPLAKARMHVYSSDAPMLFADSASAAVESSFLGATVPWFATENSAQAYADTATENGERMYANANVVGIGPGDKWIVQETEDIPVRTPVTLTLQYSIEKTDLFLPVFAGIALPVEFHEGIAFPGISFGVGIRFSLL